MKSQVLSRSASVVGKNKQQQQQIDGRVSFLRQDLDLKEEEEEGREGYVM